MTKEEHESNKAPIPPTGRVPVTDPRGHRSVRPLAPAPVAPAPVPTIGQEIGKRFGVMFYTLTDRRMGKTFAYEAELLDAAVSRLNGDGLLGGGLLEGCTVVQSCIDRAARASDLNRGLAVSAYYLTLEGEVKVRVPITFRIMVTWVGIQITLTSGWKRLPGEEALAAYGRFKLMREAVEDHVRARWDQPF